MQGGQSREILLYNKYRVFAFVLALGEVDDLKYATAAGAISYGFPTIADTVIPQILPTGITQYEHVISMPFDDIEGENDTERAQAVRAARPSRCAASRSRSPRCPSRCPTAAPSRASACAARTCASSSVAAMPRAFEYLRWRTSTPSRTARSPWSGPPSTSVPEGGAMNMGIVVEVAGRKMQEDFEPVLERQIHYFVNGASGIQHIGQRDITWIRLSKAAVEKGFQLKHFGEILYARFHADFGAIVDKVQVTDLYRAGRPLNSGCSKARDAYQARNMRLADMIDESVDEFYSCTLCQSFAPNHVCVVSPERLGLCGAYNWLDCKASHQINPTGPNQPITKGVCVDPAYGVWQGPMQFVYQNSHQAVERVSHVLDHAGSHDRLRVL